MRRFGACSLARAAGALQGAGAVQARLICWLLPRTLSQGFRTPDEVKRFHDMFDELCYIVATKHSGSLKGEHGTGRNVAPYVEMEWGEPHCVLLVARCYCMSSAWQAAAAVCPRWRRGGASAAGSPEGLERRRGSCRPAVDAAACGVTASSRPHCSWHGRPHASALPGLTANGCSPSPAPRHQGHGADVGAEGAV